MRNLTCVLAVVALCTFANLKADAQSTTLKSQASTEKVLVRFSNLSNRRASVIWMDYNGYPQVYKTLEPYEILDAFTYRTHPWVFQDARTTERLLANKQYVFYPETRSRSDSGLNNVIYTDRGEYRTLVTITEPRSCCASCSTTTY
uniref:von Hippel-Lindau disease tumour suppressor beta domain-containing protein n=1 Tax=Clastoptera arizonana TaxID=38151 RepID=A0A1B6CEA8_9HEMI